MPGPTQDHQPGRDEEPDGSASGTAGPDMGHFLGERLPLMRLFLGEDPSLRWSWPEAPQAPVADAGLASLLVVVRAPETAGPAAPLETLLAECGRMLRPGGRISMLWPNRTHRFVTALSARLRRGTPGTSGRAPVDAQAFGARRVPPLHRLMRGLRAGGFDDIAIHAAEPGPGIPDTLRERTWRDAWSAPMWLVTARRSGPDAPTLLDAIVLEAGTSGPRPASRWFRVTHSSRGKSLALARRGDVDLVIHLPHEPVALADEAEAHRLLVDLQSNPRIATRVPKPLARGSRAGQAWYAESRLPGVPLSAALSRDASRAARSAWLREADAFLRALNPGLEQQASVPLTDGAAGADLRAMQERLLAHLADPGLRRDAATLLDAAWAGMTSRIGIAHGDFGTANILVAEGRISGVIDWEAARRAAAPALDAFNYLDGVERRCNPRRSIVDTIPMLADGDWPVDEEREFLSEQLRRSGIDGRFHRSCALLYFLFHVGPQLRFAAHEEGPRRRTEQILRRLIERA